LPGRRDGGIVNGCRSAFAGCGGAVTETTGTTTDTSTTATSSTTTETTSTTDTTSTTVAPGEWTTLIDGTWELPGGTEGYWCARKTIQQDTYVKAFRALAPPGTHHTLLIQEKGGKPDGEFACGATLGADMLHASGVGTDDLVFPEGVAVKIPAGTQLMLNLHLFNVQSTSIAGVSGTLVQVVPASEVQHIAQMELGGTANISVPPNGTQTVEGVCTFPNAATLTTVWPHMHQYGTHMKVTYEGASGAKVLHDAPYSFGDQKNHQIDPLAVAPGEVVRIQCTYANPTSQTINWGDSSNAEMCFAGLYTYPPLVPGIQCQ
jgi:hypothetical protein